MLFKKNFILILFATSIVTNLTACKAIKDKFVRKKDEGKQQEMYLDLKYYQESGSFEFYKKYFFYAKGWLEEVQKELESGSNLKRIKVRMDDALGYIGRLEEYVNAEGKNIMKSSISEFKDIREEFYKPYFMGSRAQGRVAERLDDAIRKFVKTCSEQYMTDYLIEQ